MQRYKFKYKELGMVLYITYLWLGFKWYRDERHQYYVRNQKEAPLMRVGTLEDVCCFLHSFVE